MERAFRERVALSFLPVARTEEVVDVEDIAPLADREIGGDQLQGSGVVGAQSIEVDAVATGDRDRGGGRGVIGVVVDVERIIAVAAVDFRRAPLFAVIADGIVTVVRKNPRHVPCSVAVVVDRVVSAAAVDEIRSRATIDVVLTFAAGNGVVPLLTVDRWVASGISGRQIVVARPAIDDGVAPGVVGIAAIEDDGVVAAITVQLIVVASAAIDRVGDDAAKDRFVRGGARVGEAKSLAARRVDLWPEILLGQGGARHVLQTHERLPVGPGRVVRHLQQRVDSPRGRLLEQA